MLLADKDNYVKKLMQHYGRTYQHGDYVFHSGNTTYQLYYLVAGQIQLLQNGNVLRTIEPDNYFGEMAMLSNTPTIADAIVTSEYADVITIHTDNIETLLIDEPKVAMRFLRELAGRLQKHNE